MFTITHQITEISQIFSLSASQAWAIIGAMDFPVLLNTSEINTVFRRVLGLHAEAITTLDQIWLLVGNHYELLP